MPHKIIFLKKHSLEMHSTAAVVGASGFFWRSFGDRAEVEQALQRERFDLVIVDHRVAKEDPLQFINQLPAMPPGTPILLITVQHFELQNVIQAIRLGIKDVFHPPLDLKTIMDRVQALSPSDGSQAPMRQEQWSEFVMFLAGGEVPGEKNDPRKAAGKGSAAELATKLALASQERDGLLAERTEWKQAKAQLEAQLTELQWESERQHAAPAGASVAPRAAVPGETLAAEKAALEEQRQALATQEKALAEAHARFVAEQEEFEAAQLVAEQAQSKVDQVVGELGHAAEKLKQQRIQVTAEQRKAGEELAQRAAALEATARQHAQKEAELAARLSQLQQDRAALAAEQAGHEQAVARLRSQEEELKQAQAAQKAAHEKAASALAAKTKEFETKQQQFREQMKQMLAAN